MEAVHELIATADAKLNWMLYEFENRLNVHMLKLQYGPNYVDNVLDQMIAELSTDKVIGYEERQT